MSNVCMVAYANYFTDARIKNYVEALLKAGHEVDVFALGKPEPARLGLRVFCLMSKTWSKSTLPYVLSQLAFFMLAMWRVSQALGRRRYSLVHVHNMPDFIVFVALLPKLSGAKVILDVHDTMPETYATKFNLSLSHPLIALLRLEERISAAFADAVITTNDLHREALMGHGISADKISIVMNVGNDALFRPQVKRETVGPLTLAYHGTIAARLGVDLILEAIHLCISRCPELRFVLIGDGDYMPSIKQLIVQLDLTKVVSLSGFVPVECLPERLARVDVGIVGLGRNYELHRNWGLPVKMLEYAAMEIPTIAPRLRVIAHYFDDTNAILYRPDDVADMARCIQEVYLHRDKLERLKEGLRGFNQQYSWPIMEKRYFDLINQSRRSTGAN